MEQCTIHNEPVSISSRDVLTEILRSGAQKLLAETIENEVAEYIQAHSPNSFWTHALRTDEYLYPTSIGQVGTLATLVGIRHGWRLQS